MLSKCKPGVSIRTHQIVAATIWSVVGILLLTKGFYYLTAADKLWLLMPAIVLGTCKSLILLDKSAKKNIFRLNNKKDGSCLGGVYSPKMWAMVIMMIVLGRFLRSSGIPLEVIGTIYGAVGWALFFSSRLLWNQVRQFNA